MDSWDGSSKTKMAFRLFDMNKDGYITREEFKKVAIELETFKCKLCFQVSKNLDVTQIEAVFQRFDLNKDGRLSKGEFRRLMEKS